ncbi:MAG: hypothetical protein JSR82_09315 [Verrucomicrobia bacterium]|nr:hypothetical protein [Verrucomicrobiota bacterium]
MGSLFTPPSWEPEMPLFEPLFKVTVGTAVGVSKLLLLDVLFESFKEMHWHLPQSDTFFRIGAYVVIAQLPLNWVYILARWLKMRARSRAALTAAGARA